MSWRRRLRDIAIAGGFVGGAAYGFGVGCGTPACNANLDPCCGCSDPGGCGRYYLDGTEDGGTVKVSCSGELECAAKPTAECCLGPARYAEFQAAEGPCTAAGFGFGGTGPGGTGGAGPGGDAGATDASLE